MSDASSRDPERGPAQSPEPRPAMVAPKPARRRRRARRGVGAAAKPALDPAMFAAAETSPGSGDGGPAATGKRRRKASKARAAARARASRRSQKAGPIGAAIAHSDPLDAAIEAPLSAVAPGTAPDRVGGPAGDGVAAAEGGVEETSLAALVEELRQGAPRGPLPPTPPAPTGPAAAIGALRQAIGAAGRLRVGVVSASQDRRFALVLDPQRSAHLSDIARRTGCAPEDVAITAIDWYVDALAGDGGD